MQTQTLPIQVSSTGPAPQRANANPSTDGAQFSQTLSREMAQRQNSPAPAAASPAAPAKPQAAPAPAGQPAKAQAAAKPADAKDATASTDAGSDAAKDDAADAAAASPVTDMLAFIASFNQPAAAAQPASDPVASAAAVATAVAAAPALPPAVDDKAPAFKKIAQAIAGAAVPTVQEMAGAPVKDATPKDAAPTAPASIEGDEQPSAAVADTLPAPAAVTPSFAADGAGAPAVKVKAGAALMDAKPKNAAPAAPPSIEAAAQPRAAGADKMPALAAVTQSSAADGAEAPSVKVKAGAPVNDAKPKDAAPPAPLSVEGAEQPRIASTGKVTAMAAVTQSSAADGAEAPAVKVKAELATSAPRADAAPLRAREGVAEVAAPKEPAAAAPVMAPVQQASLAMAQAITGVPADRIAARVGTPGWDNQVAQKIVWMVAGKEQSASLTLNPPDMGPMQVVLSVTNDQATVTFSAAQPEVRQALENAMPKLREMMGESGIALGNATVNAGTSDQRQAQQGEQARGQGSGGRFGNAGPEAPVAATPRQARPDGGTGLVDTFA